MRNFLEETIEDLKLNGKTPEDVLWVGSGENCFSWQHFEKIANFIYDGLSGITINEDLLIVGQDWWIERHQCGMCEWWEFKTLPSKQENQSPATKEHLLTKDAIVDPLMFGICTIPR